MGLYLVVVEHSEPMGRKHFRTNLVIVIWGRGCCFVSRNNMLCYSGVSRSHLNTLHTIFIYFLLSWKLELFREDIPCVLLAN